MAVAAVPIAFIFPSAQEMILILVVGIMLFGRRLPEVGRAVAKTVVQLRQGLNKLKAEMDLDGEVSDFKNSFRDVKNEFTGGFSEVTDVIDKPRRALKDPGRMLMDLTDESLAVPSVTEIQDDLQDSVREAGETAEPTPEPRP